MNNTFTNDDFGFISMAASVNTQDAVDDVLSASDPQLIEMIRPDDSGKSKADIYRLHFFKFIDANASPQLRGEVSAAEARLFEAEVDYCFGDLDTELW
jgi:hypothetical protein